MGPPERRVWAMGALVVALAVVVQATTSNTWLSDICYLGVLVGAGIVAWVGAERLPRGQRLVPRLFAAGVSLNALGEVTWTILQRSGANTDVSIADLGWFASYICLDVALLVILAQRPKDSRVDVSVDAATIVVISVLVFWRLLVGPIVADPTESPFVRAVWASYPVLDAVLLALVVRVLVSRRARAAIDSWFAVGVCLWLAADMLYLFVPDQPAAVRIMNAAWMLAPVLMARAAWRGRLVGPETETVGSPIGWVSAMVLAVCPLIVPPAVDLVDEVRERPEHPLQLLVGMALLIALALVRTGRLIRSEQRAQRELEVARDAALAASDAKSMFLANMSHEIRTPLTAVLATAGLLTDTTLDGRQLKLVGTMNRSGQQLLALIEELLDFSRVEAGQAVVHRAEFDLHALVSDLAETYRPRAERQGIGFEWTVDPRLPRAVVGDQTRVVQLLNNLLENALKFTAAGSVSLDVSLEGGSGAQRGQVQLSVSDTGIGIRTEDQARVFDSFQQVDGSATRHYAGTGLGLAICKKIVELLGGTIEVDSEVGVGSTFTARLPMTPADPPPRHDSGGAATVAPSQHHARAVEPAVQGWSAGVRGGT